MALVIPAEDAIGTWMQEESERQDASRRVEADAAKVIATFASAVGAGLVSSALEVAPVTGLDRWAAALLGGSVVLAIGVAVLDRRVAVDVLGLLRRARVEKWEDDQLLKELRAGRLAATDNNAVVLGHIRHALAAQLIVTLLSGVFAVISLLV